MSYVQQRQPDVPNAGSFRALRTPRQNKEGKRFIYDQATRLTKHTIVYESDPEACPLSCPSGSSWLPPTSSSI